jgi:DNA-binding NarL/FixJ family response regulator
MLKLLIADEKILFQLGIIKALEHETDIKVIATCSLGEETVNKTIALKPDVVLISSSITAFDCFEVTKQIRERTEKIRIILICHDNLIYEDPLSLLSLKADSYIKDDVPDNVLVHVIRDVITGHRSISPEMQNRLLEVYQSIQQGNSFFSKQNLSKRQIEILSLGAKGLSNREIAKKLFIAENTVKTQMSVIIKKLNVPNRQRAALLALEKGIIAKSDVYK